MIARSAKGLVVAATLLSCRAGAARDAAETSVATNVPLPEASARAAPSAPAAISPEQARARADLDATLRRVSDARGLEARRPVELRTLDRDALLAHLVKKVEKELPPGVLGLQGEALRALGVLPEGYDFEKGVLALLQGQIAGFYDPDEQAMFLLDDLAPSARSETLNHELVHALQDQVFGLGPRLKYREGQGDVSAAMQALIEGDATSAMVDMLQGPAVTARLDPVALRKMFVVSQMFSPSGNEAPTILKSILVSSYVDGFAFVQKLRARDNWAAVDAAFVEPPKSTEQLLHLDKLDAREPPVPVVDPVAGLPRGFSVAYADTMGELGTRTLLEEWVPRETAEKAAAGWGGDRYVVAKRPATDAAGATEYAFAFSLAMDTVADANELEATLLSNFTNRCTERKTLGPFAFKKSGRTVFVVAGPYAVAGATETARGTCASARSWLDALEKGATLR